MPQQTAAIECPRCGYDQRGVVATWIEQCPIEGTCAECGLAFAWRELLNANLFPPRWCVEARRPWWVFPWQAICTTLRLFLPAVVWRRVQMFHPPRWGRLCVFLLFWLCLLAISMMLSVGLAARAQWGTIVTAAGTRVAAANGWSVFWHAASQPLSTTPTTFVWSAPATTTLNVGPSMRVAAGTLTLTAAPPRALLIHHLERVGVPIALLLATPACSALAFAALPISRRRAKVRCSHIVRVMMYAYGMALPLAIVIVMNDASINVNRIVMVVLMMLSAAGLMLLLPWMLMFWQSAAGSYLRMEHRWAVAASAVMIGCLLPLAVWGAIWAQIPVR